MQLKLKEVFRVKALFVLCVFLSTSRNLLEHKEQEETQ
jgi:hypothetical protein